jgi:hypothetical protein
MITEEKLRDLSRQDLYDIIERLALEQQILSHRIMDLRTELLSLKMRYAIIKAGHEEIEEES